MSQFRRRSSLWMRLSLIQSAIIQEIPYLLSLPVISSSGPPTPPKFPNVRSVGPVVDPVGTGAEEQPSDWGSDLSLAPACYAVQEIQGERDGPSFESHGVEGQSQSHDWTSRVSPRKQIGEPSGSANYRTTKKLKMITEHPDMFMPIREPSSDEVRRVAELIPGRQQPSDNLQLFRSLQPVWLESGSDAQLNVVRISPASAPLSAVAARESNRISGPKDSARHIPPGILPIPTIGEYKGFKKVNVVVSFPKDRARSGNIFVADGTLGGLEIVALKLQHREESKLKAFESAANKNPLIPKEVDKEKSWFHSLVLPTIQYTLRVALLRIRILHHLYYPVLFDTTEGLEEVQRDAFSFLSKLWQNGVIPRLCHTSDSTVNNAADVIGPERMLTDELMKSKRIPDYQQTSLSWVVFTYWLKGKVASDHPMLVADLLEFPQAFSYSQSVSLETSSFKSSRDSSGRSCPGSNRGSGTDTHMCASKGSPASFRTSSNNIKQPFKSYAADIALAETGLGIRFKQKPVILRDG